MEPCACDYNTPVHLVPIPSSPAAVVAALEDSLLEVRPLIEKLYANKQRDKGLLLSQVKTLFLKLEPGIPASRSDFLGVLPAASKVRGEKR